MSDESDKPTAKSRLEGVEKCGLHRRTPYGITNVSQTQFSCARFYGGLTYNGERYTYQPKTDELIRNDVLKWQRENRKKGMSDD